MQRQRRESRIVSAVAEWRRRSIELAARLRSTARDVDAQDHAWLWRIQLRILHFLLRRYEHTSPETIEPVESEPAISIDPAVIGPIQPSEGRRPRSREEIRAVLTRIAVANGGGSWSRPLVRAA